MSPACLLPSPQPDDLLHARPIRPALEVQPSVQLLGVQFVADAKVLVLLHVDPRVEEAGLEGEADDLDVIPDAACLVLHVNALPRALDLDVGVHIDHHTGSGGKSHHACMHA